MSLKPLGIKDIKGKLLAPALTSLYYVTIGGPKGAGWNSFATGNLGAGFNSYGGDLNLMCSEASLPGSSLATLELTNDYTGVTQRHAYRRVYDDRIDLTFYVDAENYVPIRYFETWIKYISQETVATGNAGSTLSPNFFYRFAFPDQYLDPQAFTITKFEKSSLGHQGSSKAGKVSKGGQLKYTFVNSFPISISSMPVSYDSSSLLKCTVSMSYVRYYVGGSTDSSSAPTSEGMGNVPGAYTNPFNFGNAANLSDYLQPGTQAGFNAFNFGGEQNFFTQSNGFDFSAPKGSPAAIPPTPTQIRQGTQGLSR
jgi:hypothetical protein